MKEQAISWWKARKRWQKITLVAAVAWVAPCVLIKPESIWFFASGFLIYLVVFQRKLLISKWRLLSKPKKVALVASSILLALTYTLLIAVPGVAKTLINWDLKQGIWIARASDTYYGRPAFKFFKKGVYRNFKFSRDVVVACRCKPGWKFWVCDCPVSSDSINETGWAFFENYKLSWFYRRAYKVSWKNTITWLGAAPVTTFYDYIYDFELDALEDDKCHYARNCKPEENTSSICKAIAGDCDSLKESGEDYYVRRFDFELHLY
mgnify:CR=1 FL=1